jgi:hypothetical protein
MSLEKVISLVGKRFLVNQGNNTYEFNTAPSPHKRFDTYQLKIIPGEGLLALRAGGVVIYTNVYGTALKAAYEEIQSDMKSTFGPGTASDFVNAGSLWTNPQDWMTGLLKKERILETFWEPAQHLNGIAAIKLSAAALIRGAGMLEIRYDFQGWGAYLEAKKSQEGKVF